MAQENSLTVSSSEISNPAISNLPSWTTTYAYDAAARLHAVLDPRVSAKPFLYTYDTRASVVAQLAMPTGQTIAYARDAQGRLLSTTLSGIARQTLATHAYTYDLAGQRTTATTASATTAYTYDALRQLATATETPAGTGLPFAPAYDANGTTTTLPSGLVLDYDEENRLVSAATLTAREEYTYDGLGRRVERRTFTASSGLTAPATTTRYVYDGWRVLEELTSTQSLPFTLHSSYTRGLDLSGTLEGAGGIGGLLAMTRDPAGSATSAYYFHDGNGNVSTLVSASDALLASYTYTPFGDTLTATGTWASVNAYRFSAKECDAFTGLYYYGFRYYNPSTGRWLSRDPLEERGGLNLYGFVSNSPVVFFDPVGLDIFLYFWDSSQGDSGSGHVGIGIGSDQKQKFFEANPSVSAPSAPMRTPYQQEGTMEDVINRSENFVLFSQRPKLIVRIMTAPCDDEKATAALDKWFNENKDWSLLTSNCADAAKCGLRSIGLKADRQLTYSTPQELARYINENYAPTTFAVLEGSLTGYSGDNGTKGVIKKKGQAAKVKVEAVIQKITCTP